MAVLVPTVGKINTSTCIDDRFSSINFGRKVPNINMQHLCTMTSGPIQSRGFFARQIFGTKFKKITAKKSKILPSYFGLSVNFQFSFGNDMLGMRGVYKRHAKCFKTRKKASTKCNN